MKIFSTEQIREADAYTIKHEPIKSIDLMERAAAKCFDFIYDNIPNIFPSHITEERNRTFRVVCGTGNNGGDGLVIARMLMKFGYHVEVVVVRISEKGSEDFNTNFQRLGAAARKQVIDVKKASDIPDFGPDSVIIDAVFGSGLNRPAEGVAADVIDAINRSGAPVVAVDLPSGVFADGSPDSPKAPAVRADHVLTFQLPKLAFFLAEYDDCIGEVHILDIGLHPEYMEKTDAEFHLFTERDAAAVRKRRRRFSHKGTFGHALIIGGSPGKWGAAVLAAESCLRSGAGLVTVRIPGGGAQPVGIRLPEAMTALDPDPEFFTEVPDLTPYSAVGIGPGLGTDEKTVRAFKLLLQQCKVPLVIDADALNILAEHKTWLAFLPKGSILTPHPGEFSRLIGEKASHRDGLERQRELSAKRGVNILLKGAYSSLSTPDGKIIFNRTGNPGMATGGTGDVLTGVITGLLASGYGPVEAAALGMFIHGKAGDEALACSSGEALIAGDLTAFLGKAFQKTGYAF